MEIACGVDEVERPDGSTFLECVLPYLLDPRRPVAYELDAADLADAPASGEDVHDRLQLVARAFGSEVPHVSAPEHWATVPVDVDVHPDCDNLDLAGPRLLAVPALDAVRVRVRAREYEHGA